MIQQLIKFFKIIRWKNVVIYILLQVLLYFVLFGQKFQFTNGWFFLTLAMISFGIFGNIQNNLTDYELDKHKKNFVEFNRNAYLIWSIIFGILGGIFGFTAFYLTFKPSLLYVIMLVPVIIVLYNYFFKKWALIGNISIAFTTALAIYIPIAYTKNIDVSNAYFEFLLVMAFWLSLMRELAKDIEDAKIDQKFNYKTLPVLNITLSKYLMVLLSTIVWLIMFSYQNHFSSISYYILLVISALLLIFSLMKIYQNKFETATKILKLLMLIGIFSIFFI